MMAQIVQIITERGVFQGPTPAAHTDPWWLWWMLAVTAGMTLVMVIYLHWGRNKNG